MRASAKSGEETACKISDQFEFGLLARRPNRFARRCRGEAAGLKVPSARVGNDERPARIHGPASRAIQADRSWSRLAPARQFSHVECQRVAQSSRSADHHIQEATWSSA